jgi:hypothetical protein
MYKIQKNRPDMKEILDEFGEVGAPSTYEISLILFERD